MYRVVSALTGEDLGGPSLLSFDGYDSSSELRRLQAVADYLELPSRWHVKVVSNDNKILRVLKLDHDYAKALERAATMGTINQKFSSDRGIVLAAVAQNGYALYAASEEMRGDQKIVLAAVRV